MGEQIEFEAIIISCKRCISVLLLRCRRRRRSERTVSLFRMPMPGNGLPGQGFFIVFLSNIYHSSL